MYRQNSASVIRDAGCQGVKLPRHKLVMNHLKDLQKTFCDTTKLTTSGRVPAQGVARPCEPVWPSRLMDPPFQEQPSYLLPKSLVKI